MRPRSHTIVWRCLGALAALFLVATASVGPAFAHGGEESTKASDLIRQAIAIMANEPDNTDAATDKLTDATNAEDKAGVDAALLTQAQDALAAGDVHQARAYAEQSIGAQPHLATAEVPPIGETSPTTTVAGMTQGAQASAGMTMATGAEPGQATFADPLSVQPAFTGRDWAALVVFVSVGLIGVFLALRFRPPHRTAQP